MASIAAHTVYATAGFRMRCSSRFTGSEPAVHGLAPIVPHLFHNLPLLSSPAFTPVSNSAARRQRHVRVNNLLGVVTLLRSGRGSNRRPVDRKSDHHAIRRGARHRDRCAVTQLTTHATVSSLLSTLSQSLCVYRRRSNNSRRYSLPPPLSAAGGPLSTRVCLSVCLSISRVARKVAGGFS